MWGDTLPHLGFRQPGALEAMLAMAALHLVRVRPDHSEKYAHLGEQHQAAVLREASSLLPRLDANNCQALYFMGVLIYFLIFAEKPSYGHLLVVADSSEVAWLPFIRGVRDIVSTADWSAILPLKPEEEAEVPPHAASAAKELAWGDALDEISELIDGCSDDGTAVYEGTLSSLTSCFQQIYGSKQSLNDRIIYGLQIIMAWLYCVDDAFFRYVRVKAPIVLLIHAHFAVLLKSLENV